MNPRDLVGASRRELAGLFAAGQPFDAAGLAGGTYQGISLGLPPWALRLTWVKFAKVFTPDGTRGWNMRIVQDELDLPWRPQLRGGRPVTFGHFDVVTAGDRVVLDYGTRGGLLMRACRDPLVSLTGRADHLLGRLVLALPLHDLPTPSYFVLSRAA